MQQDDLSPCHIPGTGSAPCGAAGVRTASVSVDTALGTAGNGTAGRLQNTQQAVITTNEGGFAQVLLNKALFYVISWGHIKSYMLKLHVTDNIF